MRRIIMVIILLCLLICGKTCISYALEAMPHTNEAVNKLNEAIDKIGAPAEPKSCGDDSAKVKTYIETYKKIFSLAGYDYERSIMRVINDIQFDRYRANSAFFTLYGLARELLSIHVKANVNPKTYLTKGCAELLIESLRGIFPEACFDERIQLMP